MNPSHDDDTPHDAVDDDDMFAEPGPIVLTGKDADDFVDMVLTRKPQRSEALARAFARRRKWFISE